MDRKPQRDVRMGLANVALLERELGALEYQREKLPAAQRQDAALLARRAQIIAALDAEHARREGPRRGNDTARAD